MFPIREAAGWILGPESGYHENVFFFPLFIQAGWVTVNLDTTAFIHILSNPLFTINPQMALNKVRSPTGPEIWSPEIFRDFPHPSKQMSR
jgi:hypothetical protein